MAQVTVGAGGRITIPRAVREQAGMPEGTCLDIEVTPQGVLLRAPWPEGRDPDQWWFWTEEWQKGEREVDEAIARGELLGPFTDEEFEELLDQIDRECSEQGEQ